MKCCALLLSLLLCLGLTGCAPAEVEIPAMPVQAAEAAEAEEPAAEELYIEKVQYHTNKITILRFRNYFIRKLFV